MIRLAIPMAALALAANLAAPLAARGQPTTYAVHPSASTSPPPNGWVLSASLQGRTVDLGEPSWSWADDPRVKPGERSLGYGWRDDRNSIVLGFRQAGGDPTTTHPGEIDGWRIQDQPRPGLLGFSWTYRPAR